MKRADLPRAGNRALIDALFDGNSPFTQEEARQNRVNVNVNFLDSTRIHQDACRQFSNALCKPGNYFNVKLDSGPIHRRGEWSDIITAEINKRMKDSLRYTETLNNVFAQVVLHGIGPVTWVDKQRWCPHMHAIADVLVPSRTLLTMENLPYFGVYRRYTAAELYRKTHGPRVDKGWNMEVVNKAIKWAGTQYGQTLTGTDAYLNPERLEQDIKSNTLLYASDGVPTINCYDFYWQDDTEKEWGWKRRIILDCETGDSAPGANAILGGTGSDFIYNPGNKNYASKLSEIIHFQVADGAVVAPFRYHSVRSLGWLLYSVCHLQNRMRSRLNEAAFENLMQYYRVANPDDSNRPLEMDLMDKGILPEGWNFVTQNERWKVNENLIQQVMLLNRQSMAENSTSYTQDFGYEQGKSQPEKTATQVTAEVNASTAMVGAMLQRAYLYQEFQDKEIARRFCIKNSPDPDVRAFQAACLRRGVPMEMLDVERWNIAHVRVMGAGNKQLEIAQMSMLMQTVDRFDPDAQRIILRDYVFAVTDNPDKTLELVPNEKPITNDSVHDAELSSSTLLLALPMSLKQNVNHSEYAAVELGMANMSLQKIEARGIATADELAGLQNLIGMSVDGQVIPGNGANGHIGILAQNEANNSLVKQLQDASGKLLNRIKALAQQLQESQQQPQNGNGNGLAPEDAVRLKGQLVLSETKSKLMEAASQQKLTHKDEAFRQKLQQSKEKNELGNAQSIRKAQVDESATDLRTAGEIQRQALKPAAE